MNSPALGGMEMDSYGLKTTLFPDKPFALQGRGALLRYPRDLVISSDVL